VKSAGCKTCSRYGTGSEPLTRDPTRSPSVCLELRDHFVNGVRTSECLLPKVSGLFSKHTEHENFQHNCKFIEV